MIYRTDYHIHSSFSDGRAAPEDYIAPAIVAGLTEIGFSEHLTLFHEPLKWSMGSSDVEHYLKI
jgi:histidinol phosphatase-like PHP family hydrolase